VAAGADTGASSPGVETEDVVAGDGSNDRFNATAGGGRAESVCPNPDPVVRFPDG